MVKMKGINVLNYGRMTQRNLIVNCLLKAAVGLLLIPSNAPQFSSLAINSGHNIIKHEFSAGVFIVFPFLTVVKKGKNGDYLFKI